MSILSQIPVSDLHPCSVKVLETPTWFFAKMITTSTFHKNTYKLNSPDHTRNPRDSSASRPHTGWLAVEDNIPVPWKRIWRYSTCCYLDALSPLCQTCSCRELDFLLIATGKKNIKITDYGNLMEWKVSCSGY